MKESELLHIAKMLNQIIHRMVKPKIDLEFYKVPIDEKPASLLLTEITIELLSMIAISNDMKTNFSKYISTYLSYRFS